VVCTDEAIEHISSCYWFVCTEVSRGKSSHAHILSCSTNLVINGLGPHNFNANELYCVEVVKCIVFFLFFSSSLLCHLLGSD